MRGLASDKKILEFMRLLGRMVRADVRVYLTGGATAVIMGWRDSTVDIDLGFSPELDEVLRAIPLIKEQLNLNIELALPSDFIPAVPGWETRCQYIGRQGKVSFYHYDPYSQVLSKAERGHSRDIVDIEAMIQRKLIDPKRLWPMFLMIEPFLYKYPAIDAADFSAAVKRIADA